MPPTRRGGGGGVGLCREQGGVSRPRAEQLLDMVLPAKARLSKGTGRGGAGRVEGGCPGEGCGLQEGGGAWAGCGQRRGLTKP